MEERKDDLSSHLQWFRNRNRKNLSMNTQDGQQQPILSTSVSTSISWLKTTFSDLDEKTQAMLKLIEEDAADSFAKRAEMYYKRRPQLIQMVQDFHRAHRSLAERYQLITINKNYTSSNSTTTSTISNCDPLPTTSPSSSSSESSEDDDIKSSYPHSCSSFYPNDDSSSTSSEEDQQQLQKRSETASVADGDSIANDHEEVMLVRREEMESLVEENRKLKEQMMQKDEEKREAIRQLCFSLDLLREEHEDLMAIIIRKYRQNHATHEIELDTLDIPKMFMFWRRLFLNL